MSISKHNLNIGNELAKLLGLPKGTKWFRLTAGIDRITTIECEYFQNKKLNDTVIKTKYELVEIK